MSKSRSRRRWSLMFLAGPVIWYLYFWIAYLAAEAGCSEIAGGLTFLGFDAVSFATIVLTGISVIAIARYVALARADLADDPKEGVFAVSLAIGLGVFFVVATLFVGLPALVLAPC